MIALATVERPHYAEGTDLQFEMTVEAVRHRVGAKVREDAVLQPAAKNRDAAGMSRETPGIRLFWCFSRALRAHLLRQPL